MIKNKRNEGFTLVELLVVIAIIGILATIVTMNVTGAIAKSRDSRRKEDIANINKAMGLFYINNSTIGYPVEDTCSSGVVNNQCDSTWEYIQGDQTSGSNATATQNPDGSWTTNSGGTANGNKLITDFSKYLPTLPTDPLNTVKNSITYKYIYLSLNANTPRVAVIRARLELDQGGNFGSGKCFGFIKGAQWTEGGTNWVYGSSACM